MKLSDRCVSSVRLFPALALVASALVCACSGKSTTGSGSLDAAPSNDGAAGDVTTSSEMPADAGVSDGGMEATAIYVPVATQLLDDGLAPGTDGPGTASGNWYTYSDREVPWSEPPTLVPNAPGVLVPESTGPVLPSSDGAGPTYLGSVWPYRRFSGGGESLWGAGMAMTLSTALPDGGPVPMNACGAGAVFDVDAAGMDSAIDLPFDASGWTGIQFWAKSLIGYPRTVRVIVEDDRTDPFGLPLDAGGCNACANFTQGAKGYCGDGPQASVAFAPEWTHVQLPFASMHPVGIYSGEPTTWTPNTNALFGIEFELDDPPLAPFDLAVAYVELYK